MNEFNESFKEMWKREKQKQMRNYFKELNFEISYDENYKAIFRKKL